MDKIIGRIIEVKGLAVKAKLFTLLPPYLVHNGIRESAPKINGFIKTRIGLDVVICQVIGEYSEEVGEKINGHFLQLEVKGYLSNGKFVQGLRILPIVSANIELLEDDEFNDIYVLSSQTTMCIGRNLFDENKKIHVDVNSLLPSHIGIFGNTGSGKSNTLTKILSSYYETIKSHNTKNGKFIVFDLNNEYGDDSICDRSDKEFYKLNTNKESKRKIPLNLESLNEDSFVILMNASQKTQAPVVKNAFREMMKGDDEKKEEKYYLNYVKSIIRNSRKSLFFSMRHYLKDYFGNLDYFCFHSLQGKMYYKKGDEYIYLEQQQDFESKLNEISVNVPKEPLQRFLFELYFSVALESENGVNLDFLMPLVARARKLISDFSKIFDFRGNFKDIFHGKNVCVIQLSNVNRDMKEIVPSIIADNIFNRLQESKEEKGIRQIINIVIDEAHSILYDSAKDVLTHDSVLQVFEKVIKEGRKFGLFLMLASQRPSDISQTIISQLHNYFIHKLVNPSDIQMIRKAVAYMDENSLNFITILAPGECIVSGTSFQMPTFMYVEQVEEKKRPNSDNPKLMGKKGLFENIKQDDLNF
ncbi:MAG: ATP-binding protein [Bacteroidales bacterium]